VFVIVADRSCPDDPDPRADGFGIRCGPLALQARFLVPPSGYRRDEARSAMAQKHGDPAAGEGAGPYIRRTARVWRWW